MQVSTVTISSQNIVALAQTTIASVGIKCEWGSGRDVCNVVVACWESLQKHYHQHLYDVRSKRHKHTQLQCQLPRCSARFQPSFDALQDHIVTSHLSRVIVVCPIDGCRSGGVLRSNTISKHFVDEHLHLDGRTVQLPSAVLKPSWRPFYPSEAVKPPPPLPHNPSPGCVLVSTSPAPRSRKKLSTSPPTSSQISTAFASPRKQSRRQIPKKEKADDDEDELTIPDFAPLPGYPESACHEPQEFVVWRRPTVLDVDVARPQRMHEGPIKETPTSILYEVFAQRVDELERKNLLS
ncbi:hypothetical protein FPV67DRAFT_1488444 [Lyophyllum atratum]|nr:hypothetical protein FPV67DRAFT_1488444 [Lyophyllum atratum]